MSGPVVIMVSGSPRLAYEPINAPVVARVAYKDARYWRFWAQRAVTTINQTIYFPVSYRDQFGAIETVLVHEVTHARQFAAWGRFWWVLALAYMLIPPVRYYMERSAYLAEVQAGLITPEQAAAALASPLYTGMPSREASEDYFVTNKHVDIQIVDKGESK